MKGRCEQNKSTAEERKKVIPNVTRKTLKEAAQPNSTQGQEEREGNKERGGERERGRELPRKPDQEMMHSGKC